MKQINWLMSVAVAAIVAVACVAQAGDMEDAKGRRKARRAQIVELVQSGDSEEGSDGYLIAKAGLDAAKAALVNAENADRKIGYEAIAKANGKTVEEVGKQAAVTLKSKRASKK